MPSLNESNQTRIAATQGVVLNGARGCTCVHWDYANLCALYTQLYWTLLTLFANLERCFFAKFFGLLKSNGVVKLWGKV